MNKIIIANWKLNPTSMREAERLAEESDVEGLIICPPFPFINAAAKVIKKAKLGAQNLFWEKSPGAYTGEVSPNQLKKLGVEYVIIGHSERRQNLGETDEMAAKKVKAAIDGELIPILCVGETRAERDAGKTKEVVERELKIGLSLIKNPEPRTPNLELIVAYEPIWAIGTGTPDTPENMIEMTKFIKKILHPTPYTLHPKVLYGGSVTSENAEDFLKHKEIEGALVGGASLNAEEIKKIAKIASKCG